jgi:hypothetical protein
LQKIRPNFFGRIILFYKVSDYLLSLIAACGAICKRGKLVINWEELSIIAHTNRELASCKPFLS